LQRHSAQRVVVVTINKKREATSATQKSMLVIVKAAGRKPCSDSHTLTDKDTVAGVFATRDAHTSFGTAGPTVPTEVDFHQ